METTTIKISKSLAEKIKSFKITQLETYDEILIRILKQLKGGVKWKN